MLREFVESSGTGADVIAELGIDLNPTVKPRGHVKPAVSDTQSRNDQWVPPGRSRMREVSSCTSEVRCKS